MHEQAILQAQSRFPERQEERRRMVEEQLRARDIVDSRTLAAMEAVPRHVFVPDPLEAVAYEDEPLPMERGQIIPPAYVVAAMVQALRLRPGARVLEVGTGSGYAAAVLALLADEVFTIERHEELARSAEDRLRALGFRNVHVRHGDGSVGWSEHAPYDAIVVAAGGPSIPPSLQEQLAVGGRLIMPVGARPSDQTLTVVERTAEGELQHSSLGPVRAVPLLGEQSWQEVGPRPITVPPSASSQGLSALIRESSQPIEDIEDVDLSPLLDRIGDARVVLLGEATHGTSEFYRMRARITRELVLRRGFRALALEADWPDARVLNQHLRGRQASPGAPAPFQRFPQWMWRNREFLELTEWLRAFNEDTPEEEQAQMYGLDLYSLYASIAVTLEYLDRVDPREAEAARERYACLLPWQEEPAAYGRAVVTGRHAGCEEEVVAQLRGILERRLDLVAQDGDEFLNAVHNAHLIVNAEKYYRAMYRGSAASWNLRDTHMFDTLRLLLARDSELRVVVWAHNSHVGDALATEMAMRGEINIGSLCRQNLGDRSYLIGFGTDRGRVAAATHWGGHLEYKSIVPSRAGSYERLCHDAGRAAFLLPLRDPAREDLREELSAPRLARAIGVIYRPESELQSHYYQVELARQFDEYIWFDETEAVTALAEGTSLRGPPETFPSGL